MQKANFSSVDMRYSEALFKATYGDVYSPHVFLTGGNVSDFIAATQKLRKSISYDWSNTIESSKSQKVLADDIYTMSKEKEQRLIYDYINEWSAQVDQSKFLMPEEMIVRYLLQPQIIQGRYRTDHLKNHLPVYKTNQHLLKTTLDFLVRSDRDPIAQRLIKDMETYAKGESVGDLEMSHYDRANFDKFDYNMFSPEMANSVRSLAKHLDVNFTSPLLLDMLNQVVPTIKGPMRTIQGNDGTSIPVRKGSNDEIKYSDIRDKGAC